MFSLKYFIILIHGGGETQRPFLTVAQLKIVKFNEWHCERTRTYEVFKQTNKKLQTYAWLQHTEHRLICTFLCCCISCFVVSEKTQHEIRAIDLLSVHPRVMLDSMTTFEKIVIGIVWRKGIALKLEFNSFNALCSTYELFSFFHVFSNFWSIY